MKTHEDAEICSSHTTHNIDHADVIRLTANQLRAMPHSDTRLFNALAFVLTRVADADRRITVEETQRMECILVECASLTPPQAALVAEIAGHRARLADTSRAYGETRHLRRHLDAAQRQELLECLQRVADADGQFTEDERLTILQVAAELGFTRSEVSASGLIRSA